MTPSAVKKNQTIKQNLIDQAIDHSKKVKPKSKKLVSTFSRSFCLQIPAEDIAPWKAEELSAISTSLFELAQKREAGVPKIRIYNPDLKKNKWHVNRTVVEIINTDRPFLIDSIASELLNSNQSIEVLFHPILNIKRDEKDKLVDIDDVASGKKGYGPESYIHIQLENLLSEQEMQELEGKLLEVIDDVIKATTDWPQMLEKLEGVIESFGKMPEGLYEDDIDEARLFMQYLHNNNFTLLGYVCDDVKKTKNAGRKFARVRNSSLGLFSGRRDILNKDLQSENGVSALDQSKHLVVISKLVDRFSTVHRRVPFDMIAVKRLDNKGNLIGRHVFIGLFTSSTYSCRTSEVPIVRKRVERTLEKAAFGRDSHDDKALEHILEKYPRDELFQIAVDDLYPIALGILRLQERQRTALFTRMDILGRYMSCIVYTPREIYNSRFRKRAMKILEEGLDGKVTNFHTTLDDSPLARVLFTVSLDPLNKKTHKISEIEDRLIEVSRGWDDALKHALVDIEGKKQGSLLFNTYQGAFGEAYKEKFDGHAAVYDIRQLEQIDEGCSISVDFYKLKTSAVNQYRLKVYHDGTPVPLSDILPTLENMGFRVLSELPFEVIPYGRDKAIWIHDFELETEDEDGVDLDKIKAAFEDAFLNVWTNKAENDGLNALILKGGTWPQVNILRTYLNYLRQVKFPYSRRHIESVLVSYPDIAGTVVKMFLNRHDPKRKKNSDKVFEGLKKDFLQSLEDVSQLDHDRILRGFLKLVENTLRTNYFQKEADGNPKHWLSMKISSANLDFVPKPRPFVEIFVYSTRFEAVHLRGGPIARGGLRWSDRHDDFRTEILGLVKAQNVKNAVIVPVGSKGGFVLKNAPKGGTRQEIQNEAIACYKMFIQAMLDLTDNLVKGKVKKPKDVVCHDGDDPYLVVAADKGTATFSDIANGISLENDFWLGDAFASGGSAGYDHKAMGITARGAWESVKRHFREMGKDIQSEDFTCIGVGDMGGDVFGNGMLLSEHTLLKGAFNHLHIFCDPNPDAAKSFKERDRLFKARGGWDQYNKKLISKGGGVFNRSDKTLKLSKEIREAFGLQKSEVSPSELIQAMLKAEVELLWFGGIGTYIKSSHESHADADDKSNDGLRIDGKQISAKVIGEGANLGMTQKGRIEFAQRGGRLNTDFIDNSAGVDCSDHEVNIKILLGQVMQAKSMNLPQRDKLLEKMTEQVAELVLKDNYQQTQAITMCQYDANAQMARTANYLRKLEREGALDRRVEDLPDDEVLDRMIAAGEVFTRPEFSTILCYSKIEFYQQLLNSKLPEEGASLDWLYEYFPKDLQKYKAEIEGHKLKKEIIATNIANTLINRMGPVFVHSRVDKTGARPSNVARAFVIAVEAFGARDLWAEIEKLDNKVPAEVQEDALFEVFSLIKRVITWILRHDRDTINTQEYIDLLKPGVKELLKSFKSIVPDYLKEKADAIEAQFIADGLPNALAKKLSYSRILVSSCDILKISQSCSGNIKAIGKVYFDVGQRLQIDLLREELRFTKAEDHWQARVLGSLNDELYIYQAAITRGIIQTYGCPISSKKSMIEPWLDDNKKDIEVVDQLMKEIWRAPEQNASMLILAGQRLGQLAGE